MADIPTRFGATRFTIAIPLRAETIADLNVPASARTREDFPRLKTAEEIQRTHAAADSAVCSMAVTCEASRHAAGPAWAAAFLVAAVEDMQAADTADADIDR